MIAITGLAAPAATPAIDQLLLGAARSPLLRGLVDLAFASRAVIAGYHAAHGIAAAFEVAGLYATITSWAAAEVTGIAAWSGVLRHRREPHPAVPGRARGTGRLSPSRGLPRAIEFGWRCHRRTDWHGSKRLVQGPT